MTLARSRSRDYLELTATLLLACRAYFVDSGPLVAVASSAVDDVEAMATRPGEPASAVARRWRTSLVFVLVRRLRDGLAGVALMVESASVAAGPHAGFMALSRRLAYLDDIFKDLRTEPWSLSDRRIVERLRTKAASADLIRVRHELAVASAMLEQVLAGITAELEA